MTVTTNTPGAPLATVIERYRPFIESEFDGDTGAFAHDCVSQCCRCDEFFARDARYGFDAGGSESPDGWVCQDCTDDSWPRSSEGRAYFETLRHQLGAEAA